MWLLPNTAPPPPRSRTPPGPKQSPSPPPHPERDRPRRPQPGPTCAGRTAAARTRRFRVGAVTPPLRSIPAPNHNASLHPGMSKPYLTSARLSGCHFEIGRKCDVITRRPSLKGAALNSCTQPAGFLSASEMEKLTQTFRPFRI